MKKEMRERVADVGREREMGFDWGLGGILEREKGLGGGEMEEGIG